jgi:hypothetical protein
MAPAIYAKIVAAVKAADSTNAKLLCRGSQTTTSKAADGEAVEATVGDEDVHIRCMEFHTVRPGGSLADPCHYDWGSLLTLDIMLAGTVQSNSRAAVVW